MIYIVDAQYLLRRNYGAMVGSRNALITSDALVRSVRGSIKKITSDESDQVWLLYDKQPYFKSDYIPEYKKDREYISEEGLQKLIDSNASESEIIRYRIALQNSREFVKAKYKLIGNDDRSIIIRGYEADDLARFLSSYYNSNNTKCILYTIDSDWLFLCNNNVSMMTPRGVSKEYEYNNLLSRYSDYDIPLDKIGILLELYSNSHNNVPLYKLNSIDNSRISFKQFSNSIYNNINDIPDFEIYRKYYTGLSLADHKLNIEEVIKDVHKRIVY